MTWCQLCDKRKVMTHKNTCFSKLPLKGFSRSWKFRVWQASKMRSLWPAVVAGSWNRSCSSALAVSSFFGRVGYFFSQCLHSWAFHTFLTHVNSVVCCIEMAAWCSWGGYLWQEKGNERLKDVFLETAMKLSRQTPMMHCAFTLLPKSWPQPRRSKGGGKVWFCVPLAFMEIGHIFRSSPQDPMREVLFETGTFFPRFQVVLHGRPGGLPGGPG